MLKVFYLLSAAYLSLPSNHYIREAYIAEVTEKVLKVSMPIRHGSMNLTYDQYYTLKHLIDVCMNYNEPKEMRFQKAYDIFASNPWLANEDHAAQMAHSYVDTYDEAYRWKDHLNARYHLVHYITLFFSNDMNFYRHDREDQRQLIKNYFEIIAIYLRNSTSHFKMYQKYQKFSFEA